MLMALGVLPSCLVIDETFGRMLHIKEKPMTLSLFSSLPKLKLAELPGGKGFFGKMRKFGTTKL